MAMIGRGRTWDDACSPAASRLARSYESAWRANPEFPPDPGNYLPEDPDQRSGALLALLRVDLALRREAGESFLVEQYRERHPELGGEILVALLYEEFCLREEAGETPDMAEYEARFPGCAAQLREILEIHEWVGSTWSHSLSLPESSAAPLPEVGQTIGGFRLVGELGRGAFARVFLAEERLLADRPVALKVARRGSSEPQTLARLQHTHIVPVHSYRTDPATGLHLLCMPYFGRVTLAALLNHPRIKTARSGDDLVAIFDDLRPPDEVPSPRAEGRAALAGRTFPQAVAWWGARLAEALQHAHDQGVLHSDVKPSNVLVTADAIPMLLDFNLSHSARTGRHDVPPPALGGTLAYMAPEHLEAVAYHSSGGFDRRTDIYSLGVVLFEVLASRPFSSSFEGWEGAAAVLAMIEERRTGAPWEKLRARKVPGALEAVIRKCLAPEPVDRYPSAAELAADLQAVAVDGPLRFAREPQPSKTLRWLSRNRQKLALAVPLAIAGIVAAVALFRAHAEGIRREALAHYYYSEGLRTAGDRQFVAAATHFATAEEYARGQPGLRGLSVEARARKRSALDADRVRRQVDAFFQRIEPLRFRLIMGKDLKTISRELEAAFGPFQVLTRGDWTRLPDLESLDPARRARLLDEVNEVLFLWVVASEPVDDAERGRLAVAVCDRALQFAEPKGPWLALRSRAVAESGFMPSDCAPPGDPSQEWSARACFQWGLLALLEHNHERALAWMERAVRLRPDQFWYQFALAFQCARFHEVDRALDHYSEAIALRPDSAWALLNRAQLYWSRKGSWGRALEDLERVRRNPVGLNPMVVRLETGLVAQRLGAFGAALADYEAVIASDAPGDLARRARLNRAKILADLGATDLAWREYDGLLTESPRMSEARIGRALLALRLGRPIEAEADLTHVLHDSPQPARRAEVLAARVLARLALGRPIDARKDAAEVLRLGATPGRLRLWARVALASGCDRDLGLLEPDDVDRLPFEGPGLWQDLSAAAGRLKVRAEEVEGVGALPALRTRAVVLGALGRHTEALADADRALALAPASAQALLTRARVRRRAGDVRGALADVERGIALDPADSRLLEFRGRLRAEGGQTTEGLADLERAILRGAGGSAHAAKARTLLALGRAADSLAEWNLTLRDDPDDPAAFLGRARAFRELGQWDQALADLENASDSAADRPATLARITLSYAACLPGRPDRFPRVLSLARRAALLWLPKARQPTHFPNTPPFGWRALSPRRESR